MEEVHVEIAILSSDAGHCVVVSNNGQEVHRTIEYPDRDFAMLHAKEIEKIARDLMLRHQLNGPSAS